MLVEQVFQVLMIQVGHPRLSLLLLLHVLDSPQLLPVHGVHAIDVLVPDDNGVPLVFDCLRIFASPCKGMLYMS